MMNKQDGSKDHPIRVQGLTGDYDMGEMDEESPDPEQMKKDEAEE